MRFWLAIVIGVAWAVTLPITADALARVQPTWASIAFVPVALATAGLWWLHMREREGRIGLGGRMAGWLFVAALALLGVSGFLWLLVAMAVVASAIAYGVVLLVTQAQAPSPRQDLVTGLLLFATGGATAIFAVTTGLPQTDAWWMPAHWILAIGIAAATIVGARPGARPVIA